MTKQELNAKLKELGNVAIRVNYKVYRNAANKMIKGVELFCVGPYTVNDLQYERFKNLVQTVKTELNGYVSCNVPEWTDSDEYAEIIVGKHTVVMALRSFNIGDYTHYYAAFSVK